MAAAKARQVSEFDFVDAPPEQPRDRWGVILTKADHGARSQPAVAAEVMMFRDRSRFFVNHTGGQEQILSPHQFVAFILELKRSGRYSFDRRKPGTGKPPAA
jgi:hypothetical protein